MATKKQKTDEEKKLEKYKKILTKLVSIFNDIYITKLGHIISMDKDDPFVVILSPESLDIIKEFILKDEAIIHITNLRKYKKDFEEEYIKNVLPSERISFYERLNTYTNYINAINEWKPFYLDEDKDKNFELMVEVFKDNKYLSFKDDEDGGPSIVFTKELIPLANEKNFEDISFRIIDLTTMDSIYEGLYLLTFKFEYDIFTLYSLNLFIDY